MVTLIPLKVPPRDRLYKFSLPTISYCKDYLTTSPIRRHSLLPYDPCTFCGKKCMPSIFGIHSTKNQSRPDTHSHLPRLSFPPYHLEAAINSDLFHSSKWLHLRAWILYRPQIWSVTAITTRDLASAAKAEIKKGRTILFHSKATRQAAISNIIKGISSHVKVV